MGDRQPLSACSTKQLASIQLFCSDMDGTWLGPDHKATPEGLLAIKEAEAAGLVFCFATGRCPLSAQTASGLRLSERPGVYSNGAVVLGKGGKELYKLDLPPDVVDEVVGMGLDTKNVAVLLCDRDSFFGLNPSCPWATHLHEEYNDPVPAACDPALPLPMAQLVHLVGDEATIDALEQRVLAAVGGRVAVARNLPTDCTITSLHANKGYACEQLRQELGIRGAVLGIGDSGNDVPMLTSVELSIAMANAKPKAKAAAGFETKGTNDDPNVPGVLEAVRAVSRAREAHPQSSRELGEVVLVPRALAGAIHETAPMPNEERS